MNIVDINDSNYLNFFTPEKIGLHFPRMMNSLTILILNTYYNENINEQNTQIINYYFKALYYFIEHNIIVSMIFVSNAYQCSDKIVKIENKKEILNNIKIIIDNLDKNNPQKFDFILLYTAISFLDNYF